MALTLPDKKGEHVSARLLQGGVLWKLKRQDGILPGVGEGAP
jgi:hypothetical protein